MKNRSREFSLATRKQGTQIGKPRSQNEGYLFSFSLHRPRPQSASNAAGWVIPKTAPADRDAPVDVLDLKPRSVKILADLRIHSIRQLLSFPKTKLLQGRWFGPQKMAEVEGKVFWYLAGKWPAKLICRDGKKKGWAAAALGTKALVGHMLSFLPERERDVLVQRYGFWNGETETLGRIGDRFGRSRERVRQIEGRGLYRVRRVFNSLGVSHLLSKKLEAARGKKARGNRNFLSEGELIAVLADDCSDREAAVAAGFLRDAGLLKSNRGKAGLGYRQRNGRK